MSYPDRWLVILASFASWPSRPTYASAQSNKKRGHAAVNSNPINALRAEPPKKKKSGTKESGKKQDIDPLAHFMGGSQARDEYF